MKVKIAKSKSGRPMVLCPYCPKMVTSQGRSTHIKYRHPGRQLVGGGYEHETLDNHKHHSAASRKARLAKALNLPFAEHDHEHAPTYIYHQFDLTVAATQDMIVTLVNSAAASIGKCAILIDGEKFNENIAFFKAIEENFGG